MKRWTYVGLLFLVILLLSGNDCEICDNQSPDLIIINPYPDLDFEYCDLNYDLVTSKWYLGVTIKNQGSADASSFTVAVDFSETGIQTTHIDLLYYGDTRVIEYEFELTTICFNPDCFFTITVDYGDSVSESNETNNTVTGRCEGLN